MAGTKQPGSQHRSSTTEGDYVTDDPVVARIDPLMFQMLADISKGQATLTEAVSNLKLKVDAQSVKLDRIDDLRVNIGKLETEISHLKTEIESTKTKLDKVRSLIFAAGGIVALFAVFAPSIVNRIWPVSIVSQSPALTKSPITPPP